MLAVTGLIGMFGIAVALGGFYRVEATITERLLFLAGGLLMVDPGWWTDLAGIAVLGAAIASQIWRARQMDTGTGKGATV